MATLLQLVEQSFLAMAALFHLLVYNFFKEGILILQGIPVQSAALMAVEKPKLLSIISNETQGPHNVSSSL